MKYNIMLLYKYYFLNFSSPLYRVENNKSAFIAQVKSSNASLRTFTAPQSTFIKLLVPGHINPGTY